MPAFERLSPALQYTIANELGWSELRPVQEQTIEAVLDGANVIVLAPTAGGKTEASLFPLLSLMDEAEWGPTSVLYVAPIRALLNNQEARLSALTGLIGRRAFKWHGDVKASARKRFIRDPADVLAITPESLEAMLMSTSTPGKALLEGLRAVVIDEVHAFAADDRGAHLVALLERITRLAGRDIQRIGLSATIGDPEDICAWLSGSSQRPRRVVNPGGAGLEPELQLDYVGSLENAAIVIEQLHRGERRLVFVDSRRRVEALGDALRQRDVDVYLSHSSLAVSERAAAEEAFAEGQNCVIVATSAMELGIDVGDLDRVLQIDAPSTVASLLQRMGRTGRRAGARANCTFLATEVDPLVQAAALLRLRREGFVEAAAPAPDAVQVLAHQLLALALQQFGVGEAAWWGWLEGCAAFRDLSAGDRELLVCHMLSEGILAAVDGRLILGEKGEALYGGRNFLELYAVFSTPRTFTVLHGPREVGSVDVWFLQGRDSGPLCFVLAGERWQVVDIQWRRGICLVKRADQGAYPRWMGTPQLLSRALCQSIREVLVGDEVDPSWSRRAAARIGEQRGVAAFLREARCPLLPLDGSGSRLRLWTHAGGKANATLAALLNLELGDKVTANNLTLTFAEGAAKSEAAVWAALRTLAEGGLREERLKPLARSAAKWRVSKFQPCLPELLEDRLLTRAVFDVEGARAALRDAGFPS